MARSADSGRGLGFWANCFLFFHKYGIIVIGVLVILAPFLLDWIADTARQAVSEGAASAGFWTGLQTFLPNVPLLIQIIIYALYGIGFNILLGSTGVLSLGHCAFFGVGGYTAGLMFRWLQITEDVPQGLVNFFLLAPVEFAMIGTVIVTFLVALFIGYLGMRKVGVYFAMLTLALSQVFYYAAQTFDDFTGGTATAWAAWITSTLDSWEASALVSPTSWRPTGSSWGSPLCACSWSGSCSARPTAGC